MGYVEEMESLSQAIRYDDHGGEPTVDFYTSWLTEHPSALDAFGQMMSAAKGKYIVVFLDYDGTLSRIVQEPDKAFMTGKMRSAVDEVARCFPTAIISGRSRDKVYDFVKLDNIYYAGSHGMDISTPSGSSKYSYHKHQTRTTDAKGIEYVNFRPAFEFLPTIAKVIKLLKEETKGIKGAVVEDNTFCISVHYRSVKEEEVDTLKGMVETLMKNYKNFRISGGKKVMEIRPKIDWNKGRALQYLLDTPGFGSSTDVLPIYIGDDKTDEDAFEAIRRIGRGFPIVVSSTPKETKALYSLRDPSEVKSFLSCLAAWRKDT
ncbi:probable trehalose-phosphate phosphatase 2 isoform X2 [Malus sylvestris]|uniref:probable trehalose-phosphate phosphatase 2 isoform X2 n=1 Tax=Malus sylvestris TaxID=3752 RepID=UPI0021AC5C67|nr:probable trehalose-phosphate phosphatase 2 isoform X2 [Malus sylvestris]